MGYWRIFKIALLLRRALIGGNVLVLQYGKKLLNRQWFSEYRAIFKMPILGLEISASKVLDNALYCLSISG